MIRLRHDSVLDTAFPELAASRARARRRDGLTNLALLVMAVAIVGFIALLVGCFAAMFDWVRSLVAFYLPHLIPTPGAVAKVVAEVML